ncbi:MAG: glycosyltransferase family 39 protein, partial [Vicinamibacterales bacterium]
MTDETPPRAARRTVLLLAIVAVAAAARLWNLRAGVPFAVGIDEPQVVDRALRILKTGDWNTHLFDYPTLAIYLHAIAAAARFLWGAVRGEWTSLAGFRIRAVYTTARLLTAAIGVATVWLTYRIGARLGRRDVGLLAAAQMAVQPSHVRESHFALTDVPAAALTTAAVLLAVRAADRRTVRAYAAAGALSGLAAATKYIGGIALSALAVVWIVHERRAADRWPKALAAAGAAAAAFLAGAPYTVLDLPGFLDGFARQFARFAAVPPAPPGVVYLKHLSLVMWWWPPLAVAGALIALWRSRRRGDWAAVVV